MNHDAAPVVSRHSILSPARMGVFFEALQPHCVTALRMEVALCGCEENTTRTRRCTRILSGFCFEDGITSFCLALLGTLISGLGRTCGRCSLSRSAPLNDCLGVQKRYSVQFSALAAIGSIKSCGCFLIVRVVQRRVARVLSHPPEEYMELPSFGLWLHEKKSAQFSVLACSDGSTLKSQSTCASPELHSLPRMDSGSLSWMFILRPCCIVSVCPFAVASSMQMLGSTERELRRLFGRISHGFPRDSDNRDIALCGESLPRSQCPPDFKNNSIG